MWGNADFSPHHTLASGLVMEMNQKWMFLSSLKSILIEMDITGWEGTKQYFFSSRNLFSLQLTNLNILSGIKKEHSI